MAARVAEWRKFALSPAELRIDTTLRCGQSFRWRNVNDEWSCTLHGRIISLKQDPTHLHYRVIWPTRTIDPLTPPSLNVGEDMGDGSMPKDDTEELLRHYLSLRLDLKTLYEQWSKADPNFRKKAPHFTGVRILGQDAWEALICFICSSNNNISRISQMVHKLCKHYGPLIGSMDGEEYYGFPSPKDLTGRQVETHLRELGFGYRAKYIAETAEIVATERPLGWLESLANPESPNFGGYPTREDLPQATYKEAHDKLLELPGVGPKVADCVCLMGLGWGEAVPVDTHVWQIAQRDYKFGKFKVKTLNKALYDAVGDHFRGLWGRHAGWAHSVLFTADLKAFSDGVVKKEEPEVLEMKQEVVNEEITHGKRRRTTVKMMVKIEKEHTTTKERSTKRTRTKQ